MDSQWQSTIVATANFLMMKGNRFILLESYLLGHNLYALNDAGFTRFVLLKSVFNVFIVLSLSKLLIMAALLTISCRKILVFL